MLNKKTIINPIFNFISMTNKILERNFLVLIKKSDQKRLEFTILEKKADF